SRKNGGVNMKLYQIVFKDIIRRKKRIFYAALGVVIGTMTVIGVLNIAQAGQAKIYNQLEKYGANLTIIPAISNIDTKLGNLSLGTLSVGDNYIQETNLPKIREITDGLIRQARDITDPGPIATIAPTLYVNTQVSGVNVIIAGVDPVSERNIKSWWEMADGAYLTEGKQVMAGSLAAELLKLKVGDQVNLNGTPVNVTGILKETGANEDYFLYVPLATAQTVFDKAGLISAIDVRALCNGCPVDTIATQLNLNLPGIKAVAVKQIANTEMDMVQRVNRMMLSLAGITLLIGIFGVVNTMMSSVHERTRDIGIMRAVGASRNQIIRVFIYEALVIGIIGGVFGYFAGTALAYGIGPLIFDGAAIRLLPWYLPISIGLSVTIAIIATLYPAFSATKIKIAEAFRAL
ncbi:MAG: ABC transporter permease, partial [Dehalococcoidales bacterium]|nr:ABC transporter permease [Dehalococcoidales bacterium]